MFSFIQKKFIKNYDNVDNAEVREKYGTVFSIFSIICNIILVIFKFVVSLITNSVSIRADALNNLSDVGSNVASLFGFKLSNKHPDADHPYGHGRMEYVSGMVISFLILLMGGSAFLDAIKSIASKSQANYSSIAVIVLIVAVLIKLLMFSVNNKAGKTINSDTLKAAGQDSFNDSIMTSATLVTQIINKFFGFNLDAIVGAVVSIFVIKSGIEIFKDVLDTILGQAPSKEFVKEIEKYIMANKDIIGIHDLMFHDYGPSSKFMTLHVEVDSQKDILEIHDLIDNIEVGILKKYNVLTTIHMDPVVTNDPDLEKYKELIRGIVKEMDPRNSIHDFRIVSGPTHTNCVFDFVLPAETTLDHEEIRKELIKRVKEKNDKLVIVCKIEHSFID